MPDSRAARAVRTSILIEEALLREAMEAGGFKTKRQAVEAGLKLLAQWKDYRYVRSLRGKLKWEGDLKAMRRDG
jgi:Arc/MetJ family transcription regulator